MTEVEILQRELELSRVRFDRFAKLSQQVLEESREEANGYLAQLVALREKVKEAE